MFLLVGATAFGQHVQVKVELDTLFSLVEQKDKEIRLLRNELHFFDGYKDAALEEITMLRKQIDSLQFYKNYYNHSKHVIGPRVIRRIEEMVNHN